MRVNQARRMKELERENARLKKILAESMLDQEILKEAASGNFQARRDEVGQCNTFASGWGSRSDGPVVSWGNVARHSATDLEPRMMRLAWSSV